MRSCTIALQDSFIYLSKLLKFKVDNYVWTDSTRGVLMIPNSYDTRNPPTGNNPGNLINILTGYNKMELNDLTGHECTYVIQNTTRDQDDQYLFK